MKADIKRGEIYYANIRDGFMHGITAVVIVQNDIGNKYAPTCIVIPITSKFNKAKLPTHVEIGINTGLKKDSVILCECITTISKNNLLEKIGEISKEDIKNVENATDVSLGSKLPIQASKIFASDSSLSDEERKVDSIKDYELKMQEFSELLKELNIEFKQSNKPISKFKEWIIAGVIGAIISAILSLIIQ
ncbi:type II toxin-antitoxin system PemK/MazF family toxin [Clostridium botulinum]|nr:type II toxin-antitoxin system PemK/MazF family toxin [Clostridium botulinum]NFI17307.1 type II toxin-antitoxin system PemK/MazF family toxin [Clostridium botulinum]NFL92116.1 type II toxin-antitoxin system PemK/MazF family toxin [Clostridium botulinum]NFN52110.1 type II toxin-antitoxin system PemK/MazF family toxin [Clostridium botulinum]NFO26677.1 type II toxin-antitoxin system PemK/MazF family toxin [Clostridium botulinum]